MCTYRNKLNRSCSESDLFDVNFDNLSAKNCASLEKNGTFVKKVLYVEEVIHSESPAPVTRFFRGAHYQILGRSTPDHIHNLENDFIRNFTLDNTKCAAPVFSSSTKEQFNDGGNNHLIWTNETNMPMEIDNPFNKKSEDCVDFVEDMDIDFDAECYANSSFSKLDNMLKNRKVNKTSAGPTHLMESPLCDKTKETRTRITALTQLKRKVSKRSSFLIALIAFISIICGIVTWLVYFHGHIILSVNSDVQCLHIQKDLLENVHGQSEALNTVVRTLQQRERWHNKIKVLSFIGSTGVGKTFVANIVKKYFHQALTHELYGFQLNYKSQWSGILTAIRSCCLNLVIIDDLKRQDATNLFSLIHSLPPDQFVLVISIFNIQYSSNNLNNTINYNDIFEIRNEFDNSGLYHELIIFNEFNNDQVKDWMIKQIHLKNKSIDLKLQDQVLENILKGHEVKYKGLKGLHSKLSLELEQYKH